MFNGGSNSDTNVYLSLSIYLYIYQRPKLWTQPCNYLMNVMQLRCEKCSKVKFPFKTPLLTGHEITPKIVWRCSERIELLELQVMLAPWTLSRKSGDDNTSNQGDSRYCRSRIFEKVSRERALPAVVKPTFRFASRPPRILRGKLLILRIQNFASPSKVLCC